MGRIDGRIIAKLFVTPCAKPTASSSRRTRRVLRRSTPLSILAKAARGKLFGKSPVGIYWRLNRRIWQLLPSRVCAISILSAHTGRACTSTPPARCISACFSPKPSGARTRPCTHKSRLVSSSGFLSALRPIADRFDSGERFSANVHPPFLAQAERYFEERFR